MGGKGSGGARPNSGPKPKTARDIEIDGNAGHHAKASGRVLAHPSSMPAVPEPVPVEEFDAPDDLTMAERHVWLELAPHAFAARTLTKGTALAFKLLCRNVVMEGEMRASVLDRGRTAHQGLIAKVDAELLRFALNPCGKAMYQEAPAKVVNPLEKYLKQG
jgi:hypothetical protein